MTRPPPETRPQANGDVPDAEFDRFASGYDGGMEHWLQRLAARSSDDFADVKAEWLLRFLRQIDGTRADGRSLLDFGCGTAAILKALRRLDYAGELAGCDVSTGMLEEARRTWNRGALPDLLVQPPGRLPYDDHRFDVAVASGVFHHISPPQRRAWYAELRRVLRVGGYCVIFEHNPWNPVTRWVVSRIPIDAGAVLLSPHEAKTSLRDAGFEATSSSALMYFPPRLRRLRPLERALSAIPLGTQYVAVGRRRPTY